MNDFIFMKHLHAKNQQFNENRIQIKVVNLIIKLLKQKIRMSQALFNRLKLTPDLH